MVADFLGALQVERLHVAAVSMGTYGAIELAARDGGPEVLSLTLISSVMFALTPEEVEQRTGFAQRALSYAPERMRASVKGNAGRVDYAPPPGAVRQLDIFWVRSYPYYYQVFRMAVRQADRPQDTDAIECPVLFLHGTEDETYPVDVARGNPSVFPAAATTRWIEIAGAGHEMVFSHGPRVVGEIFAFLETVPAGE